MNIEEYSKYKQFYNQDVPELLLKYLDKENWKNYLDLGCGDGSLLYALKKRGYFKNKNVFAIDLSANRIDFVKKNNEDFFCLVSDACNVVGVGDGKIDFLVSEQVIEHVDSDEVMIKEIHRLLKKGGTVYVSTVFKKWYGWNFYRCNGKWTLDPTHLREYTDDNQLLSLFQKHGFDILENKKILLYRSLIDFVLRKLNVSRKIYENFFLKSLRALRLPILGYYKWEIICKKN